MAFSDKLAEIMREDLGFQPGLSEKRMFGGIAFMLNGNMACGVIGNGAMFRVGKDRESAALELGAEPLSFTGQKMGGMVELDEGAFVDDDLRRALVEMSLFNAASLAPKG